MIQAGRTYHQAGEAQAGFALWDTLLLVALIAALLAAAFVSQQSRLQLHRSEQQAATLLWADQHVAGFATSHLRLPCPDTNDDGLEDCAAGATDGWLPIRTLGLQADAAVRGPVRIKYGSVLRPSGMDLAQLESYFEPETWDGTKYSYGTANGLDFCAKLRDVGDSATAYKLRLVRKDGEPDLVRTHAALDLRHQLSCITTMSSVNGIALAVDVVNEVIDQQASTKEAAIIAIAFNVLHIALAAIDVSLAAIGLAASITALGVASGLLSGAIASCVVLVGCALIPPYTAAVVAAGVAIGLFGTAIALGAAAIVTLAIATATAADVAIKAGLDPGSAGGDVQVDLGQQEQAVINAENKATEQEAEAAQRYTDMVNAENAKNTARNTIQAWTQINDPSDQYDPDVNAAIAASEDLDTALQARDQAQGDLDQANDRVSKLSDAYTQQQAACASANLPDEQYKCDAVPEVYNRLQAAQDDVPVKQDALNTAATQLAADQAAYDSALQQLQTDFGGTPCNPLVPSMPSCLIQTYLNDYKDKYLAWMKAKAAYTVQKANAEKARESATNARNAYNDMVAQSQNPGSTPSGNGLQVWSGAEAILKHADANGVVQ